jgi:3-isopropylmalate/(R)-2-methylmalate dehydratase small subunit
MEWIRSGTAWVYGDHVVGDDLIGGPQAVQNDIYDPQILADLLMQDMDPMFASQARPGDFIVAGSNFGYSKMHQQVYLALVGFGVGGVIAASFQPFLRRAFPTYAIPFIRCTDINQRIQTGDQLQIDFRSGEILNKRSGNMLHGEGIPQVLIPYYEAGDHLTYLKHRLCPPR